MNGVLEKARGERFLGSALEAKVLLHVADAELAESLQALQGVSLHALDNCLSRSSTGLKESNESGRHVSLKALDLPNFLASPVLATMQVPCHRSGRYTECSGLFARRCADVWPLQCLCRQAMWQTRCAMHS